MPRTPEAPLFRRMPLSSPQMLRDLPLESGRSAEDYEFQVLSIPRGVSIGSARKALTAESEYGRWDLVRTRLFHGGGRLVWMRRRIIRMRSTLQENVS
ncbi:DUF5703 family protein [Brachybacterium sp. JHP9]|uniref:DUF5703 family protein n=1 Tax=Brachybacterium equifaecis TaxID=2910770 RepID=A0ABT0R2F3_9MICO|nr:DUF5703 family protein [Brachybacterium equifaecis]